MRLTPEFEADIRERINPKYVDQRGCESYERAILLGEIDRMRTLIADIKAWGVAQYMTLPLDLRERIQAVVMPNV